MTGLKNQDNDVKEAIIKTVAFFDLFQYPLTVFEARKYLYFSEGGGIGLSRIQEQLAGLAEKRILEEKQGFFFLAGRREIINERLRRYNYTLAKISRAKKIARIFRFIPWVKMIAVANLIGAHNLKEESDIDLFILASAGRVWTTRFFCVLLAALLNQRPRRTSGRDKICLSFFLGESNLNLKNLALESDPYFYYWLAGLVLVYERGAAYRGFMESNVWIKNQLPNWEPAELPRGEIIPPSFSALLVGRITFGLAGWLEPFLRRLQLAIFPKAIGENLNQGNGVKVGKNLIKLHVNDRRELYRSRWEISAEKILQHSDWDDNK